MAWYKEWFGQEYLELYAHRNRPEAERHVDFVERHFPAKLKSGARRTVLDLACGGGRHTEALRHRGYRAVGVDLSLTLLATAAGLPRVGGDMRCLPFADGTFDTLLNFFTSFGYFESERENFRVLEEVVRILRPGGRFLIDFMNSEYVLEHLRAHETQENDGRRLDIERWYEPSTRRINKRIRIRTGSRPPRCYLESVRAYSAEEVTIGMRWAGLEVDQLYGSFQGDDFSRESERLIILGHKPS